MKRTGATLTFGVPINMSTSRQLPSPKPIESEIIYFVPIRSIIMHITGAHRDASLASLLQASLSCSVTIVESEWFNSSFELNSAINCLVSGKSTFINRINMIIQTAVVIIINGTTRDMIQADIKIHIDPPSGIQLAVDTSTASFWTQQPYSESPDRPADFVVPSDLAGRIVPTMVSAIEGRLAMARGNTPGTPIYYPSTNCLI